MFVDPLLGDDCRGYAHYQPDLRVQWDGLGFLRIFYVSDVEDTTIDTIHPSIEFDDAFSGQYDIWASNNYVQNLVKGTLYFAELEDINPDNYLVANTAVEHYELGVYYEQQG